MSSNRTLLAARALAALLLAACVASCASSDIDKVSKNKPITPTEQFPIKVTPTDDQILLAPHSDALSPAQTAALHDLADRWRDDGDGTIKIQTPAHGGEDAYRATALIQDALFSLGVSPDQVKLTDYDAGPRPHAPIVVGFVHYEAKGPDCGRKWKSFTRSSDNDVNNNFGCATTANIAALIANPADLIAPRSSDLGDAGRREIILGKYRQGQNTSSARDSQASGTVSSVGN
jgi:pilus assembly protein CpaD